MLAQITIDLNVAQTIQAVAALIGAIFAGLAYMKANKAVVVSTENQTKIEEVHKLTNSLSERAQGLAREAGHAEGALQGRRDQTEERRVEAASIRAGAVADNKIAADEKAAKTAALSGVPATDDLKMVAAAENTVAAAEVTLERANSKINKP